MNQLQEEEFVDGVKALLGIVCVLSAACAIGFTLAIIKAVLLLFGIQPNI